QAQQAAATTSTNTNTNTNMNAISNTGTRAQASGSGGGGAANEDIANMQDVLGAAGVDLRVSLVICWVLGTVSEGYDLYRRKKKDFNDHIRRIDYQQGNITIVQEELRRRILSLVQPSG